MIIAMLIIAGSLLVGCLAVVSGLILASRTPEASDLHDGAAQRSQARERHLGIVTQAEQAERDFWGEK